MYYNKKISLTGILNFLTIACSISFKVTILPYMIFSPFQYSDFFPLVLIAVELFTIIINKKNGLSIRTDFIKFRPLGAFFGIMVLQLIIACLYFRVNSIGATIFYSADCYLLSVLVYSLCQQRTSVYGISEMTPIEYEFFSALNVILVCLAAILMTAHIIPSMVNDVSEMCILFKGNVETGQRYYMPFYISLQNGTTRLTSLGELTGWAFEPHLFCLLVFPAMFFTLGRLKKTFHKVSLVVLFLFSAFWGFSVTGLISLAIVGILVVLFEGSKSIFKIAVIFIGLLFVYLYFGDFIKDSLLFDYTRTKLVDNTTSADYSKGNLEWCLTPSTLIGQGIMRWDLERNNNPDIGLLSFFVLIVYYISSLFYVFKAIMSNNRQIRYIGYGVLYMLLHSLKMANAIFYMPIVSMNLIILYIACQVDTNWSNYESIKNK